MSNTKQKFYLTTPIYYVNARPHIGHAYTTIVADVIARRHRLLGDDTFFLTGTDEHGQKIERSAAAAGIPPQEFADQVSAEFRNLWKRMGITNDDYIRTTDSRHKQGAQKLFALLQKNGFIELRTYTGQYSVGEEMFIDGPPGTIGPDGKPTETVSEENYFFKLSHFQRPLIDLIESGQLAIQPEARRNEVLSFLRGNVAAVVTEVYDREVRAGREKSEPVKIAEEEGRINKSAALQNYVPGALKDLSISRSSFKWGIPVPGDEKHVIYVWLDALANYMTAIGYGSKDPEEQKKFEKYWPADLHLVGKEIIRFHCVYWPAFLMAMKPADHTKEEWNRKMLPKQITAHGWLLFEDSKMSKSRGNIVRTETILDAFGEHVYKQQFPDSTKSEQDLFATDILRYFLLREIPFGQDGSFSFDAMVQRYNSDLANGYGNLVSRTLSMIHKYFDSTVPVRFIPAPVDTSKVGDNLNATSQGLSVLISEAASIFEAEVISSNFSEALRILWDGVAGADGYLTIQAPWRLASNVESDIPAKLGEILYTTAESIRIITALLHPVMPYATAKVWAQLGLGDIEADAKAGKLKNLQWGGLKPGTKLGPLSPIFPRADKGLIQIMTDMETLKPEPSKLIGEKTTASAVPADPTHPGAPPRTSAFNEPNPGAQVGGAAAPHPDLVQTPPHTEAPASAPFAAAAAASLTPDTPQITIDDFVKIDLRVAKIVVAERIPKADKLLRLEVDLGYEKRQILSGIAQWYTPEELIGRRIVVIANLAPRKMRGLESHGMLLAASHGEDGKPILATFAEDIELGSRLK